MLPANDPITLRVDTVVTDIEAHYHAIPGWYRIGGPMSEDGFRYKERRHPSAWTTRTANCYFSKRWELPGLHSELFVRLAKSKAFLDGVVDEFLSNWRALSQITREIIAL